MRYLKQSTASQTRTIGPFVDSTDFVTAATGLTIANTDVRIKKNGANDVAKNSGGATHDVNGCYHLTFDATDTDTVGEFFYSVKVAGALQVFGAFTVLEEAVYDMLFGASAIGYIANQPVDLNTIKTQTVTCAAGVTVLASVGTAATSTAQTGDSYAIVNSGTHGNAALKTLIDTVDNILDTEFPALVTTIGVAGAGLTAAGGDGSQLTAINLPNQTMDIVGNITGNLSGSVGSVTGAVGSVTGAVGSVTGNVGGNVAGSVGSVTGLTASDVAAIKALLDDARGEPGQGNPPVNPDLATKIDYLYKWTRNKKDNDGSTTQFYADDGTTVDQKQTTAESGGTVTKSEIVTGP